jgi:hypothetical protein
VVECNLAKVEVAGSNPVSRSSHHRVARREQTARQLINGTVRALALTSSLQHLSIAYFFARRQKW